MGTIKSEIKVYRHSSDHLELNPDVAKKYKEFWNEDTAGVTDFEEQRFVIQQKLLEAFLSAIQTEIDSISQTILRPKYTLGGVLSILHWIYYLVPAKSFENALAHP